MGRKLRDVIAALPPERQKRIEKRRKQLKREVEGLRELRLLSGKAQADIATSLGIKQPSVSKIEKQTDMYLSTLRGYVEAMGGHLVLLVTLPKRPILRLQGLGGLMDSVAKSGSVKGSPGPISRKRHVRSS